MSEDSGNYRVEYRIKVRDFDEGKGSFILQNVKTSFEAWQGGYDRVTKAFPALKDNKPEGFVMTVKQLAEKKPLTEQETAAANMLCVYAWPALVLLAMGEGAKFGVLMALALVPVLWGAWKFVKNIPAGGVSEEEEGVAEWLKIRAQGREGHEDE